jgi:hypothetical protein
MSKPQQDEMKATKVVGIQKTIGRGDAQTKNMKLNKKIRNVKFAAGVYAAEGDAKPGDVGCLVKYVDTQDGSKRYGWVAGTEGVGGNMDHSQKETHGWRGTTNDTAIFAEGLWQVLEVKQLNTPAGYGLDIALKLQQVAK